MKNVFLKLTGFLIMAVFITSCNKEDGQAQIPEEKYAKEISFLVNEWQFDRKEIKVIGHEIIAQGDIIFDGDHFWSHVSDAENLQDEVNVEDRQHRWHGTLISTPNPPRWITLRVLPSASAWAAQVQLAADAWNARKSKIRFACQSASQEVETAGAINIKAVNFGSGNSANIAAGEWPSGGNPGIRIRINTTGPATNQKQKRYTLTHEIGHCVGLCHTDSNDDYVMTNISFSCQNFLDPSSVMRQGNNEWTDFSSCDKEAIKALYGQLPQ